MSWIAFYYNIPITKIIPEAILCLPPCIPKYTVAFLEQQSLCRGLARPPRVIMYIICSRRSQKRTRGKYFRVRFFFSARVPINRLLGRKRTQTVQRGSRKQNQKRHIINYSQPECPFVVLTHNILQTKLF